jgi:hypothetical protein
VRGGGFNRHSLRRAERALRPRRAQATPTRGPSWARPAHPLSAHTPLPLLLPSQLGVQLRPAQAPLCLRHAPAGGPGLAGASGGWGHRCARQVFLRALLSPSLPRSALTCKPGPSPPPPPADGRRSGSASLGPRLPSVPTLAPPGAPRPQVYESKRRGLRLLLTIGNLWPAYKSPEEFLLQATGSAGAHRRRRRRRRHRRRPAGCWPAPPRAAVGTAISPPQSTVTSHPLPLPLPPPPPVSKDVLDFYSDPHARALFKHHIWVMVGCGSREGGPTGKDPDPAGAGYPGQALQHPASAAPRRRVRCCPADRSALLAPSPAPA